MAVDITIEQAIDLGHATLARMRRENLQLTFNTPEFALYNRWFREAERDSGDCVKEFITLQDTGNAKMISLWEEDTHNTVNTDHEIKVDWVHATTNMTYSRIEVAMNKGNKVRLYNYLAGKQKNMFRELAEMLQLRLVLSPTSASDSKNPHGMAAWLSLGTDDSAGGFTGYKGRYNDGSGTQYAVGGITASATVNPRWASYYADHNGRFGDNIVDLLSTAFRKTHFIPPVVPQSVAKETTFDKYNMYTNDYVLRQMEALARAQDDKIGPDLSKYMGRTFFKGVPFQYLSELDTARANLYGTNPIFGVNHDHFKVVVLKENDFVISKPTPLGHHSHNLLSVAVDVSFACICDNRQAAGFLISQQ